MQAIDPRTIFILRPARLLLDSIANHADDLNCSSFIDGRWVDIQPGDEEWRELVTLDPTTIEYLNVKAAASADENFVNMIIRTSNDKVFMIYCLSVFDVISLE